VDLESNYAVDCICQRNKISTSIDIHLLGDGGTTTSIAPSPATCSLTDTANDDNDDAHGSSTKNAIVTPLAQWSWVLEAVGQGRLGATPVYKILQAGLVPWLLVGDGSNAMTTATGDPFAAAATTTPSPANTIVWIPEELERFLRRKRFATPMNANNKTKKPKSDGM
jgi:hypothetical protein